LSLHVQDEANVSLPRKFLLYSPSASTGISIPYPSISLHAIQRLRVPGATDTEVQGLYMQIATPTAPTSEDDEEQCITMTLVPPELTAEQRTEQESSDEPTETPTQTLYNAVSACSNLHPDPVEPGDEDDEDEESKPSFFQFGQEGMGSLDGDLPPPVDGSSGWITADNMHEFFDEEGNWIGDGEPPSFPGLGPGAGTVRAREEEDGEGEGRDGEEEEGEETKWRRTD
jgi:nucleotide-sensitive chloride channel 1A